MGEILPQYVTCSCQHCGDNIEFDFNKFSDENSVVACPHCGAQTKLFVSVSIPSRQPPKTKSAPVNLEEKKGEGFFCGDNGVVLNEKVNHGANFPKQDSATPPIVECVRPDKQFLSSQPNLCVADVSLNSGKFPRGTRVTLTAKQTKTVEGQEFIALLMDIEQSGFITEEGLLRLNGWLESKANSEIRAILYLLDISRQVLSCGKLAMDNASLMQSAIERVLPKEARDTIAQKRLKIRGQLPASEKLLDEIRALGGRPPVGITQEQAADLWEKSTNQATENQLAYIVRLGGLPPPQMTFDEASETIRKLLQSTRATENQYEYIRTLTNGLGEKMASNITRADADEMIPDLEKRHREQLAKQQPPTPRQMMVLRFWNKLEMRYASKWEIEKWLDEFYREVPLRKPAWELFKQETGDDGSQHDFSTVAVGIGYSYLLRLTGK